MSLDERSLSVGRLLPVLRDSVRTAHGRAYFGALFAVLGIGFAAAGLILWFGGVRPRTASLDQVVSGIVVHVTFGYVVVMSGVVVAQSGLSARECLVAAKWCFGGTAFVVGLLVWRDLPDLRIGSLSVGIANELVIVGSAGAAAGVLIGISRGQALRNRRIAEQRAEREETLTFLLQLLEHDISNHLLSISGHARLLDSEEGNSAGAIEERVDDIDRLLEAANVVLESETADGNPKPVDIAASLREQVAAIRSDAPAVDIEIDLPEGVYVEADRFVDEVFWNVLENAVVHNDADALTLTVTVRANEGWVGVEIADDGAGIPEKVREELFDPGVHGSESGGDGIGLYLVRKLVESYGGSVSVADRDPTGTRFRLRLPRAYPDADTIPKPEP